MSKIGWDVFPFNSGSLSYRTVEVPTPSQQVVFLIVLALIPLTRVSLSRRVGDARVRFRREFRAMSLTSVKMAEEVWLTCLTHALTTETEEIMGLLLGDIQYSNSGNATALIWGASPQMRSDRRKDRVETNPEMTLTTGRTTRVIGWYHSHPHITVLPSHVDVRTQAMYQLLEHGFIGLIFSCFSEDAQKVGKIQVIAFQSMDGKQRQAPPVTNSSIIEVESSWSSSDNTFLVSTPAVTESFEQDTGDSRASKASKVGGKSSDLGELFSYADVNSLGKQRMRENAGADSDSSDMTPSMQEALHRSNMDMSNGRIHPLNYVHHTSTYQASLCKLMDLNPTISALQGRLKENEIRLNMLMEEAQSLEVEARGRKSGMHSESPRSNVARGFRGSPSVGIRDLHASADSTVTRAPTGSASRRKAP
ncbi:hypothetical protein C4D60_Mb08t16920 [Musa balbisiana]|uniref:MPN domain-containing protein n=1 Tax=Musa balbisiana TaxID=52838 RepID=A0A4S8K4D7_MUSBA|nr:hypothetical protein C4D60_Mb08t16920 [Musa balbisiana]